jgi:hypothetical protein
MRNDKQETWNDVLNARHSTQEHRPFQVPIALLPTEKPVDENGRIRFFSPELT